MKTNKTISFDTEIVTSKEYQELTNNNKLSKLINALLRESLKIKDLNANKPKDQVEKELLELSIQEAALRSKLKDIEVEAKAYAKEHPTIELWICPVCKTQNAISNLRCGGCMMKTREKAERIVKELNKTEGENK